MIFYIKINSFVLRIEKVGLDENVMHVQIQVDELDRGVSEIETEFQEQRQKLKPNLYWKLYYDKRCRVTFIT